MMGDPSHPPRFRFLSRPLFPARATLYAFALGNFDRWSEKRFIAARIDIRVDMDQQNSARCRTLASSGLPDREPPLQWFPRDKFTLS
jgi:hypothetical protein